MAQKLNVEWGKRISDNRGLDAELYRYFEIIENAYTCFGQVKIFFSNTVHKFHVADKVPSGTHFNQARFLAPHAVGYTPIC